VESLVGRWAGIASGWKPEELYSCVEVRARSSRECDGYLEFSFGDEIAPGGYGWAFPKGAGEWNVGVGIDPSCSDRRPAELFLEKLLARFDGGAEVIERRAGAACRSRSLRAVSSEGVLLAGDAAHQGNPLTGGGIMNALEAGDLAGRVGADALAGPGPTAATLTRYDEEWNGAVGRINDRYHRLAEVFYHQDDDAMERIWAGIAALLRKRDEGAPKLSLLAELLALPGDFARALTPLALAGVGRRHLF
jgi:digeranylgeranylglycerophospholipid reductase